MLMNNYTSAWGHTPPIGKFVFVATRSNARAYLNLNG